jgi:hypothetical protein
MKTRTNWRIPILPAFRLTACLSAAVVLLGTHPVVAQQKSHKEQLVGSWTFVSGGARIADGSSVWGTNPNGLLIFMDNGAYSSQILQTNRPKFAANSRTKGTPEENRAAVHGYIGSFGSYSVNEAEKTFTVKFEGSSYPNLEGTQQTRPFVIEGEELRITNPSPTIGGPPSQLVYKRRK